jgi:hypothetical protein
MRFLLIDASLVLDPETGEPLEPRRPSDSNGEVINEIGGDPNARPEERTTLSLTYPCDDPPPGPDCEPDLPPYDIEFDPEELSGVETVVFTVTSTAFPNDEVTVIDNFAPYAVSRAEDGFFRSPEILNTPATEITVTARAYSRGIFLDDPSTFDPADYEDSLRGTSEIVFSVTNDAMVQTEFNRAPEEAETESEVEVEVSAANGQATGAVALAAGAGAVGARSLVGALTSGSISLRALDADGDPVPQGTPIPGGITVAPAPGGTPTSGPPPAPDEVTLAEAEAEVEVEVESEAEVEVGERAAAAAAGTAITLGGTGVDAYVGADGGPVAVASERGGPDPHTGSQSL